MFYSLVFQSHPRVIQSIFFELLNKMFYSLDQTISHIRDMSLLKFGRSWNFFFWPGINDHIIAFRKSYLGHENPFTNLLRLCAVIIDPLQAQSPIFVLKTCSTILFFSSFIQHVLFFFSQVLNSQHFIHCQCSKKKLPFCQCAAQLLLFLYFPDFITYF